MEGIEMEGVQVENSGSWGIKWLTCCPQAHFSKINSPFYLTPGQEEFRIYNYLLTRLRATFLPNSTLEFHFNYDEWREEPNQNFKWVGVKVYKYEMEKLPPDVKTEDPHTIKYTDSVCICAMLVGIWDIFRGNTWWNVLELSGLRCMMGSPSS
jgi:hypothetical protein